MNKNNSIEPGYLKACKNKLEESIVLRNLTIDSNSKDLKQENAELKYKLLVYEDIIKEIRKLLKDVE